MAKHIINVTPSEQDWQQAAKNWREKLLKMPVLAMKESTRFMTVLPGCTTNQYLGSAYSQAQFYPYAADKRGDSSTDIIWRELEINFGCMNVDFVPNDYIQTLLGRNAAKLGPGQARSQMALLILSTIMETAGENLALALAEAVRDPNGDTSMDLFNGFCTILRNEISDDNISEPKKNLVNLTTRIDETNACDILKMVEFGLDPRLRRQKRFLYCDPALVDLYNESYLLTHTAIQYNKQYEQPYVEGSHGKLTFAPLEALSGSDIMFIAPPENVIVGCDGMSDMEKLEVIRHDVDTFTAAAKIFFGVEFRTIDYRMLKVIKMSRPILPWRPIQEGGGSGSGNEATSDNDVVPTVLPASITIDAGTTTQLNVMPAQGWSFESDDETVATVSDSGLVTGVSEGVAIITCTLGEGQDTTVKEVEITVNSVIEQHD